MNQYGAGTNVGNIRDNNEDSYVCDEEKALWIVADGMGGLGFGEVASAISTYTVTTLIREGHGVNQAIEVAHRTIKEYAETDGMGTNMGTTIVLLYSQGSLYNVFWVGDSRGYLYDNGKLGQITTDHSLVQSLIDQGELTVEEAESDPRRNAVTRALGVQELETVRADSISNRWKPGQKILLCSDGLTDCVSNSDIESIIHNGGDDDQKIVDQLIVAALDGGGKDNVTIVLVSAPKAIKQIDSDTHVPDSFGHDDTHIPSDDTQRPDDTAQPDDTTTQSAKQLHLNIDATAIPPVATTPVTEVASAKPRDVFRWQNLLAACALLALGVIVFSPEEKATASLKHEFTAVSTTSHPPPGRSLANLNAPSRGTIIQVGLFAGLRGAESQLELLNDIGLEAYIQKKHTDNGLLYAVLLGPIEDENHAVIVAALRDNNLNFFHWQHDS